MKKTIYQEPTMKVVKLQHHRVLMTSTPGSATATSNASWGQASWSNGESEDGGL